jgi:hypothetical protein
MVKFGWLEDGSQLAEVAFIWIAIEAILLIELILDYFDIIWVGSFRIFLFWCILIWVGRSTRESTQFISYNTAILVILLSHKNTKWAFCVVMA